MEESYIMRSFHSILFCQLRLGKLTSTGVLDFIWGGGGFGGLDFFHLLFININCYKKLTFGGLGVSAARAQYHAYEVLI